MKTIYMTLSVIILSVIATIAIAGLVSVSNLVRPTENQSIMKSGAQHSSIKMTHKEGICHHNGKDENSHKEFHQSR
jgi:hypothetical protein